MKVYLMICNVTIQLLIEFLLGELWKRFSKSSIQKLLTQLSQVSLTLYLLGVKKELSGVNSATLHGVKRTFD